MVELLTADVFAPGSPFGPAQWGIFDQNGAPILTADSVYAVEYARDYHVADYPQEMGAFESYNKVQVPYQAKVTFLLGKSRANFLNTVEAAVASLNFVSIVTPEVQYAQANLTHYSYRRERRNGTTIIVVDVWCEEIRIASFNTSATSAAVGALAGQTGAASLQAGTTQSNNAVQPDSNGNVQTVPTQTTDPVVAAAASGSVVVAGNSISTPAMSWNWGGPPQ